MTASTILLLLAGFGAGFCARELIARFAAAATARHTEALGWRIEGLQQEINALHDVEVRRARNRLYHEETDISDVQNQIRFVGQTKLRAVRPVNREAARVLYALDGWIAANRPGWRVSFEVSMGAFIKTTVYDPENRELKAAFSSYNSKRVDFLLIDKSGHPVLAVEYHGSGHDLSDDAPDRMQVKRLALNQAGIPLVEIEAGTSRSDILRAVTDKLAANASPPR
jgi:hypothetical protein